MNQCKAVTAKGTRCVAAVASPSRSLCRQHQNVLARGGEVTSAESGRKFPRPAARSTSPRRGRS